MLHTMRTTLTVVRTEMDPRIPQDSARHGCVDMNQQSVRKLRLASYKAQLAIFHLEDEALARRFERQGLSDKEKAKIARRWDAVMAATNAYQFLVELMEWHEKEKAADA